MLAIFSLALKVAMPESNTTRRAFPFMVMLSSIGLVASLWLWFLRRRRQNYAIAVFVLGNMACVALMAIPFALATKEARRENDPKGLPPEPKAAAVQPTVLPWAVLGYLPEDCNVMAGIQVADLQQQPIGAKLLARDGNVGEPLPQLLGLLLGPVELYTGLKVEDVDHLVLGTRLDDTLPVLTIVARTKKSYDAAGVAKAQAPVVPVKHLGRELYQFKPKLGSGMLFEADAQTLIIVIRLDAITEPDKQFLTTTPRIGFEASPRSFWPTRWMGPEPWLDTGTCLWWAANEIQRPELAAMLLPFGRKDADLAKELASARSILLGLRLQQDATLWGALLCPDKKNYVSGLIERQTVDGFGAPKILRRSNAKWHMPTDDVDPCARFELSGSAEALADLLRNARLVGPLAPGK
jgi:hypothetical protein